jgi:hypothetical protein
MNRTALTRLQKAFHMQARRRPETRKRNSCSRFFLALAAAAIFAGCTTLPAPPPTIPPLPAVPLPAASGWWYARFRMDWPEGVDPAWHMDLLIAHRVIQPVLERHFQDIPLWRFHRRAARDAAGHQFSFIFFATAETARMICAELSQNGSLKLARSSGRIPEVVCDDPTTVSRPDIGDTSDPNWSAPLRKAWPHYVMGASQMWLNLISEMADGEQETETPLTFGDLDHHFARINAAITSLWQNEGRHAFLHHLNALFGYVPVIIIEKRPMRF